MDDRLKKILDVLTTNYFFSNYNYTYLKAMLHKGKNLRGEGATLITGSSYATNGIKEDKWNKAVNCSMASQDLYYDFKCAYEVVSSVPANTFSTCYIIGGYYASCYDVSMSKNERESIISSVYYPLFKDSHNWDTPWMADRFRGMRAPNGGELTEGLKELIENIAVDTMLNYGTYYNEARARGNNVFNLNGREWYELPEEEKDDLCKRRADGHNKLWAHQDTIIESKEIFKDYIYFLHLNNILPVFVVSPFTPGYNKYLLPEMKESIMELLDAAAGEVHYVDFNQCNLFDARDFVDTDHLNELGAQKMSHFLAETFGR